MKSLMIEAAVLVGIVWCGVAAAEELPRYRYEPPAPQMYTFYKADALVYYSGAYTNGAIRHHERILFDTSEGEVPAGMYYVYITWAEDGSPIEHPTDPSKLAYSSDANFRSRGIHGVRDIRMQARRFKGETRLSGIFEYPDPYALLFTSDVENGATVATYMPIVAVTLVPLSKHNIDDMEATIHEIVTGP